MCGCTSRLRCVGVCVGGGACVCVCDCVCAASLQGQWGCLTAYALCITYDACLTAYASCTTYESMVLAQRIGQMIA